MVSTECHCQAFNTPTLYLGGPGLHLSQETGYPDRLFVVLFLPSKIMTR